MSGHDLDMARALGDVRIGISGWTIRPGGACSTRRGCRTGSELAYAAERLTSIEINGSFYALQRPASYRAWYDADAGRLRLRREGRAVHHPHEEAAPTSRRRWPTSSPPVCWRWATSSGRCCGSCRRPWGSTRSGSTRSSASSRVRHAQAAELAPAPRPADGRPGLDRDRCGPTPAACAWRCGTGASRTLTSSDLLRAHDVALVVADTAGRWPRWST